MYKPSKIFNISVYNFLYNCSVLGKNLTNTLIFYYKIGLLASSEIICVKIRS
jgi:hypothetical protein